MPPRSSMRIEDAWRLGRDRYGDLWVAPAVWVTRCELLVRRSRLSRRLISFVRSTGQHVTPTKVGQLRDTKKDGASDSIASRAVAAQITLKGL